MVLKILIEQASYLLQAGNPNRDSNITYQDLWQYLKEILPDIVKANLFQNKQDGCNDVDGQWIFTFENVPIMFNTSTNKYYSQLPSTYVSLPYDAGVDMVSLMESQDRPMIKVPRNFLAASQGLPIASLEDNCGYWVEGNKVYYVNMEGITPKAVLIKLVAGLDGVDDTIDLALPLEAQRGIVDALVQRFSTELQIPDDRLNDGKPSNAIPPPKNG